MANVPEKGKSKSLVAAHKVAAENHDLQYFKEMLLAHSEAMAAEEEAQAEREAAKEAAKIAKKDKKAKRKSDVADEDVEMEDVDNDGKKSKKRKKGDVSDDDEKVRRSYRIYVYETDQADSLRSRRRPRSSSLPLPKTLRQSRRKRKKKSQSLRPRRGNPRQLSARRIARWKRRSPRNLWIPRRRGRPERSRVCCTF